MLALFFSGGQFLTYYEGREGFGFDIMRESLGLTLKTSLPRLTIFNARRLLLWTESKIRYKIRQRNRYVDKYGDGREGTPIPHCLLIKPTA